MENAIVKSGYVSEGDAALVFPTQAPDTVPLFRLYNRDIHDHFYTTSASERDNAISRFQYSNEAIIPGRIHANKSGLPSFIELT